MPQLKSGLQRPELHPTTSATPVPAQVGEATMDDGVTVSVRQRNPQIPAPLDRRNSAFLEHVAVKDIYIYIQVGVLNPLETN